jgi:hypothetical protein
MNASDVTPLESACEWQTDQLGDDYVFQLTVAHLEELDAALLHAEANTEDVLDITRDVFPLPTLGSELERLTRELVAGRGVVLIRGVPVEHYGKVRASSIYWGVGMHLGHPWPQNAKGHLLGDVTDQGRAASDPTSRGNEIGGLAFPFHSDGSDLVGLFCLDAGASGGESLVANAVTMHNELARTEPDSRPSSTRPSRTTSAASRLPTRSRGTRCRSSAAVATGCSCATSALTSSRRAVTKMHRLPPRRRAKR